MQPIDAVKSLRLMRDKLDESLENLDAASPLESMRNDACKLFLSERMNERTVVLCADMGTDDEKITFTTIGQLSNIEGGRLNCLIFPATTSEVEERALLRWK
jgi:diphthamide biosynthesis methyltransferase